MTAVTAYRRRELWSALALSVPLTLLVTFLATIGGDGHTWLAGLPILLVVIGLFNLLRPGAELVERARRRRTQPLPVAPLRAARPAPAIELGRPALALLARVRVLRGPPLSA